MLITTNYPLFKLLENSSVYVVQTRNDQLESNRMVFINTPLISFYHIWYQIKHVSRVMSNETKLTSPLSSSDLLEVFFPLIVVWYFEGGNLMGEGEWEGDPVAACTCNLLAPPPGLGLGWTRGGLPFTPK